MDITDTRQSDVFGPNGIEPGWSISLTFTDAEMQDLLAVYDPASGTSPSVTICRPIVRQILDAVKATP